VKTLAGFDFSRNPALPEALLRQLAGCGFVEQAEPIVFLGEPGPVTFCTPRYMPEKVGVCSLAV
jgi:hypothetical protein